mmetsp:Transcript_27622/g.84765  ORF Transcript_27622/g.84765 Transcript_27622/m.84765 type:complete len:209 (+) Transcript_27622:1175-1801(+)
MKYGSLRCGQKTSDRKRAISRAKATRRLPSSVVGRPQVSRNEASSSKMCSKRHFHFSNTETSHESTSTLSAVLVRSAHGLCSRSSMIFSHSSKYEPSCSASGASVSPRCHKRNAKRTSFIVAMASCRSVSYSASTFSKASSFDSPSRSMRFHCRCANSTAGSAFASSTGTTWNGKSCSSLRLRKSSSRSSHGNFNSFKSTGTGGGGGG